MRFITDPRGLGDPNSKEVPLQVIGAGLPRAATSSMQAAFEILGFGPCMHMAEILPHQSRLRLFIAALREKDDAARRKMVRQLIHGHRSICDLPVVYFTPDLMDEYPDAKIILNHRPNAEVWAKSAKESFWFFFSPWFKWVGLLWATDRMWYTLNLESIKLCQEKFDSPTPFSAETYNRYNEDVLAAAKVRDRDVLQFKAEDGWEPLCKFLEVEHKPCAIGLGQSFTQAQIQVHTKPKRLSSLTQIQHFKKHVIGCGNLWRVFVIPSRTMDHHKVTRIWIYMVCIDQENVPEETAQVKKMTLRSLPTTLRSSWLGMLGFRQVKKAETSPGNIMRGLEVAAQEQNDLFKILAQKENGRERTAASWRRCKNKIVILCINRCSFHLKMKACIGAFAPLGSIVSDGAAINARDVDQDVYQDPGTWCITYLSTYLAPVSITTGPPSPVDNTSEVNSTSKSTAQEPDLASSSAPSASTSAALEPAGQRVILVVRASGGNKKRDIGGFVGDGNPSICTFATVFTLDKNRLYESGLPVSYLGDDYQKFQASSSLSDSAISKSFNNELGLLRFQNPSLPNGRGSFCQTPSDGQVYMTFASRPLGCVPVSLNIYRAKQCIDGRIDGRGPISSSPKSDETITTFSSEEASTETSVVKSLITSILSTEGSGVSMGTIESSSSTEPDKIITALSSEEESIKTGSSSSEIAISKEIDATSGSLTGEPTATQSQGNTVVTNVISNGGFAIKDPNSENGIFSRTVLFTVQFYYIVITVGGSQVCSVNAYLGNRQFYTMGLFTSGGLGVSWNRVLTTVMTDSRSASFSISLSCTGNGFALIYVDSIFVSNQVTPDNIDRFQLDFGDGDIPSETANRLPSTSTIEPANLATSSEPGTTNTDSTPATTTGFTRPEIPSQEACPDGYKPPGFCGQNSPQPSKPFCKYRSQPNTDIVVYPLSQYPMQGMDIQNTGVTEAPMRSETTGIEEPSTRVPQNTTNWLPDPETSSVSLESTPGTKPTSIRPPRPETSVDVGPTFIEGTITRPGTTHTSAEGPVVDTSSKVPEDFTSLSEDTVSTTQERTSTSETTTPSETPTETCKYTHGEMCNFDHFNYPKDVLCSWGDKLTSRKFWLETRESYPHQDRAEHCIAICQGHPLCLTAGYSQFENRCYFSELPLLKENSVAEENDWKKQVWLDKRCYTDCEACVPDSVPKGPPGMCAYTLGDECKPVANPPDGTICNYDAYMGGGWVDGNDPNLITVYTEYAQASPRRCAAICRSYPGCKGSGYKDDRCKFSAYKLALTGMPIPLETDQDPSFNSIWDDPAFWTCPGCE
ncbi:hypothetical protein FGRMN_3473 [Fusarium graminum]|nr:hypothetical protein FGRMN_3473 [Fusarium graminum]